MLELDSCYAHTFSSRDKLKEELERNILYNYTTQSFRALYGKTVTLQWHFGEGPDRPPAGLEYSCEGFRLGDTPAKFYFNILAARIYRKPLQAINGRGVLFAIADDVKIIAPPAIIAELAKKNPALAWEKAGLTSHEMKNHIFVQPSARQV
jgi:hypothetical protein